MTGNQKSQTKILKILVIFLFVLIILFSLSAPTTNSLYLFLLLFAVFCWQKQRLEKFFTRLTKLTSPFLTYLLVATFWTAIFELTLARFAFHSNLVVTFLISLGFYLPYFIIWYFLISKFEFNFLEVFYLSGIAGVLFALTITKQILAPFTIHTNLKIALLAFGGRIMATLVVWSALTSLPYLLLFRKGTSSEKPLKYYLLPLFSTFLALPFFLIWSKLVKMLLSILR